MLRWWQCSMLCCLLLSIWIPSRPEKLRKWAVSQMWAERLQLKDATKLHHGQYRIQHLWRSIHTTNFKSGYLGLCCIDFGHSFFNLPLISPWILSERCAKSLECPFNASIFFFPPQLHLFHRVLPSAIWLPPVCPLPVSLSRHLPRSLSSHSLSVCLCPSVLVPRFLELAWFLFVFSHFGDLQCS